MALVTDAPSCAAFVATGPTPLAHARTLISTHTLGTQILEFPEANLPEDIRLPIDFLHVDSTRTTDASRVIQHLRTFLSPDALILLHGTETPSGHVLWQELASTGSTFSFPHGAGLGILATGQIPDALQPFLGTEETLLDRSGLIRLRERFAQLGLLWARTARLETVDATEAALREELRSLKLTLTETRLALSNAEEHVQHPRHELQATTPTPASQAVDLALKVTQENIEANRRITTLQQGLNAAEEWIRNAIEVVGQHNQQQAQLRLELDEGTKQLDNVKAYLDQQAAASAASPGFLRTRKQPPALPALPHISLTAADITLPPVPSVESLSPAAPGSMPATIPTSILRKNILFVSGEPNTPGTLYRCERNAAAAALTGHQARTMPCPNVGPDDVAWADIIVLWRVEYSAHVSILIRLAKEKGATLVFDADDLVFIPALASVTIIDGIRTVESATESLTHILFQNMRGTMDRVDACFATTDAMAREMGPIRSPAFTLPNIFDASCLRRSRRAARILAAGPQDDLIRIGYASGTRTHQRDFAVAVNALARVMQAHPNVRLVLFREAENKRPVLLMDEFPVLESVAEQIEWRDKVPLEELPNEFARFDISIAPLEVGNVFCEVKSEIKYLEAALAGVPSVVSPTAPYRACIEQSVTGFLAHNDAEWEEALTQLVTNPALRKRIARNALNQVLWTFGAERQAMQFEKIVMSFGDAALSARAAETIIARDGYRGYGVPDVPESRILFSHDALGDADVTVIITSHNYSGVILEALESVRKQSLAVLDLIVVDDASTDNSPALVVEWAQKHFERFNRFLVLEAETNVGLGGARNIGVSASETPWFLSLDADNRLTPDACAMLLATGTPLTAYVYPAIRQFDAAHDVVSTAPTPPMRLRNGNTIDAMALIAKWAWSAAGGYYVKRDAMGWEDYDLWCCFAELGLTGQHLPQPVAEYRIHGNSMTNNVTERQAHKNRIIAYIKERHPWLAVHHEAYGRA
ncbi:MAG: glycosyltransferase [Acetobacter sp.]